MNTKDLKDEFEKTCQDVKQELGKSEFFRNLTPMWVVLGGLVIVAWVVSGAPFVLFGMSVSFGVIVALGAVVLGPPLWVHMDARKRDVKHPLGWGIFALLTTPVGALIYYLIRPDHVARRNCAGCQREVSTDFAGCPYCGLSQQAQKSVCPSCQSDVESDWRFCPYCRNEMGAAHVGP